MTIQDGGAPERHLGMFLVCTLRILWLTVARGPTVVQILFPLLDHPDHGDEGDDDERSNLPCLQITQKRSQRNLYLTTVLLGAEVGSIDIVGDNSRLVVGPGAGQGPTGSRDRGEPSRGLTQTLAALNHHPHHHCPFLLVMVWTLLELKTSQLMLQENVTIYIMGRKSLFTLGGSELEHSLRKHISSGL